MAQPLTLNEQILHVLKCWRAATPTSVPISMHYVYVLISLKDNKFYLGYSDDLKERVRKHNSGEVTSTSRRRPFKLIYYEAHLSKYDALRRERYFKTNPGKKALKIMLRQSLRDILS